MEPLYAFDSVQHLLFLDLVIVYPFRLSELLLIELGQLLFMQPRCRDLVLDSRG